MATTSRTSLSVRRAPSAAAVLGVVLVQGADLPALPRLGDAARALVDQVAGDPASAVAGSLRDLALPGGRRMLLTGAGAGGAEEIRRAGGRLAKVAGPSVLAVVAATPLLALAEGLLLGSYVFTRKSAPAPTRPRRIDILLAPGADDAAGAQAEAVLAQATAHADATAWARDLANEPASVKNPAWLGRQAQDVLGPLGVDVTVRDVAWLEAQGFGGVLAVGSGSATPPRLIEARWRPRSASPARHIVLVGKGITFDTGGLNIKHGDAMTMMHTDMSGGAAVLGALRIVASRALPIRVTALVPAAENAVSGRAMRPSDVIRHFGGRTSSVGNTDAEGRLVLADALAYAVARLEPSVVIDIATLTGAMKVALGLTLGGLFATTDGLAESLRDAGARAGEPLWRMPLSDEYRHLVTSPVADADNAGGNPGGVTAALFLEPFVGDIPWAHLDIAGPARRPVDADLGVKGATGFGARLLAQWIEDQL
ncbi:MAG: Leucyl aminopeptidase [Pseudonocardiales bacterium]|nr:Leucyl aminopeptidase [Pseudonocardiales bacterium]